MSKPRKPKVKKGANRAKPKVTVRCRPVDYSPELAEEICESIADGRTLTSICESNPRFPHHRSCRKWAMDESHPFSALYARARRIQWDTLADKMRDRAERGSDESGAVARDRLAVDTMKWQLSKMLPKIYGDKVTQEITGKEGEPLISRESTLETARWIASILYQADAQIERQGS